MEIKRDIYLQRLIQKRGNGLTKIITGIRRCGKSFLLFTLYRKYLLSEGVPEDHIIAIALDDIANKQLRDNERLYWSIREQVETLRRKEQNNQETVIYIFLDEIQFVTDFSDTLNGLMRLPKVDIYVTGSNSKMLSTDILTEFRGRGDEIRIYPLTFSEYWAACQQTNEYTGNASSAAFAGMALIRAWNEYYTYGGMPFILSLPDETSKAEYLRSLFEKVYLTDICDRHEVKRPEVLDAILNILASSVGSLTNPKRISDTFRSSGISTEENSAALHGSTTSPTIAQYIRYCEEAFLIQKAQRFDIKGNSYISTPLKYYYADVGLRNARLNFRQQEENHIMENILFNELLVRGFRPDVGIIDSTEVSDHGKRRQVTLEIDFVINQSSRRYYIQSAFEMTSASKLAQEKRPLLKIDDSFKKIILVRDMIAPKRDEHGVVTMSLLDFLLDANLLDW